MDVKALRQALCFYAPFDGSFDAAYARGEAGARIDVDAYQPHLSDAGRFGGGAIFCYEDQRETIWTHDVLRYEAEGNWPYRAAETFGGTVGMWLQIDLQALSTRSLIWLDPFHVLGPDYREIGKMWMDFVVAELDGSPLCRFGAALPRDMRQDPDQTGEGHVLIVPDLDLSAQDWHFVVGTWEGINGGVGAGRLDLYFDGQPVASLAGFEHRLSWSIEAWELRIGLGFRGGIDDFFVLDRPLTAAQVHAMYERDEPLGQQLSLP